MKRFKLLTLLLSLFVGAGAVSCADKDDPATPPLTDPGDLGPCTVSPIGAGAYKDAYLTLEFEAAPTLGTSGEIRIFRADDDTEVDRIDMAEVAKGHERMEKNQIINTMHDVIGPKGLKRYRIVNYEPVTLDGNTVTIRPHYDVLEYGTEYYVTIDKGALTAEGFAGIAAKEWSFSTKAKPRGAVVTVGAENADFRTVQAALDYGYGLGKDAALEIRILPGQYEEQLFMRYNNNITLKGMGAGPDDVRIFYYNGDDLNGGVGGSTSVAGNDADKPKVGDAIGYAGGRGVMLVESCDNLRFENLTLENTRGVGAQAEALYNNDNSGDCGLVAVNCKFLGYQDTLNLKGYCWFYNCLVAGDVDFIWGGATAALFEQCEIRVMNSGAYIVNARVNQEKGYRKGFVFLGCRLTKDAGVGAGSSWLARHGEDKSNDNVTFVDCKMDGHIAKEGWYKNDADKFTPSTMTAEHGLKEYGTTTLSGGAYDLTSRLSCAYALTAEDVESHYKDRATVLSGYTKKAQWTE
ncbi:pectinesterase family protein [uncultured Alistipes sp.]|uniref:pectinesterase family protein n=1 Tax=uncultured Alistipes sp. TaxID=538949 RepID=UPI002596C9F4|nr:pectinesterase family protein [uncultured Alistipes sp.]